MARENMAIQQIATTGLEPAYTAADQTDGHKFLNNGRIFIHVVNGATAANITVTTPYTRDGLALDDLVVNVPVSEDRMIGPFKPSTYNQPAGHTDAGHVYVDVDDDSNVTLAVIQLP